MATRPTIIGQPVPRHGLREKLTGQMRYAGDIKLPDMLHAAVLRSPHPHAEILSINASDALKLPGIHALLTPFDPEAQRRLAPDLRVLDTRVRLVGDEVAAVAAEDETTAHAALELLKVEYKVLPFVTDAHEALKPGAPQIHPEGNLWNGKPMVVVRGDIEQGFKDADLIFEETFRFNSHSAAPLEPRTALAAWEGDHLTVWKTSRGVHQDRDMLAQALGVPASSIRVVGPPLGAGYGNKDETRCSVLAAILARRARRPVRLEYTRYDEFVAGRVRHAADITIKVGVRRDGSITAISNRTVMNKGAYLASGNGVLRRSAQGSIYLYRCPNVRFEGYLTYTNRPTGGSYRGLGAPQGHFALEAMMDQVAESLGMDHLEFRLKNHVGPEGQPGPRQSPPDAIIDTQPVEGGVPFSSHGLRQCLQRGAAAIGWQQRESWKKAAPPAVKRGTGVAMCIYRGGPGRETSSKVAVHRDGRIQLITGVMDVGEGSHTVLPQMAAEVLGCRLEDIELIAGDSDTTPDAPITAGSTATFSAGLAVQKAASEVRQKLLELASTLLESPAEELDIKDSHVFVKAQPGRSLSLTDLLSRLPEPFIESTATIVPGSKDYIINSFAAHYCQVEVDEATGHIKVVRYVAAHDSGRIINRNTALNQVEGGVSQMLGLALLEEMVTDQASGVTLNGSFLEHKCPTISEYPDSMEVIFVETDDPLAPFGAKALGEPPSVPVAAAVANALHDATGLRFREVPITADKVLNALKEEVG